MRVNIYHISVSPVLRALRLYSASRLLRSAKKSIGDAILKSTTLPTQVKGIAIGNGWIDPVTQYPAYVEFAVKEKLLKTGTKEYNNAMSILKSCEESLNATSPLTPHVDDCENVMGATIDHLHST